METRICTMCGKEKSLDEFHRSKTGKYGRRAACAACCNIKYNTPEKLERKNKARKERRKNPIYRKIENEKNLAYRRKDPLGHLLVVAKARALKKGIEFSITSEDIALPEVCPLLGITLKKGIDFQQPNSYSIDRIDNSKGYIPGNVWIISARANLIKNDASYEELKRIVEGLDRVWDH